MQFYPQQYTETLRKPKVIIIKDRKLGKKIDLSPSWPPLRGFLFEHWFGFC